MSCLLITGPILGDGYRNTGINGYFSRRLKTIPSWIIKWNKPMIVPPSAMERRSELRLLEDVPVIVDTRKAPFLFNSKEFISSYITRV